MNDGNMAEGSAHLSPVTSNPINDFMGQMAQAYAALQRVPELEGQLKAAVEQGQRDGDKIASLEFRIHGKDETLAEVNAQVRSLEVERDNAQFHGLELEERLHNLTDSLRSIRGIVAHADAELANAVDLSDPPKADEPTPEPKPQVEPLAKPFTPDTRPTDDHGAADVTANEAKPYSGKVYMEIPEHVSRDTWLAGGGTDYGYDWHSYRGPLDHDLLYPAGDLHVSDGKPESQSFTEYSGERRTIV